MINKYLNKHVDCAQNYDGDMSSAATLKSRNFGGSSLSLNSTGKEPFSKSPRSKASDSNDIPDGPSKKHRQ